MREPVDVERDAYDSQGKANHRPSPRGTLSEAWKGRAGYVNGVLGSSSIKLGQKVNSAALCYLILLLLIGALSFQHHLSQTYKLQRLDRSSKQWEGLYSQSLEEIIDWKKKLEHERKLAAEFAKNTDLLEITLKRVREEKRLKEEEAARLQVDVLEKDKQKEQLARRIQEAEDDSQSRLQGLQQEVQVKRRELESMQRELEEYKLANRRQTETISTLDKENDTLTADKKGLEGQAATMKRRGTEMESALRELQGQLQNVTRHSNYLEEHVANLADKNKLLEQESRSKLDTTAKQMRDQVDAANAKVEAAQKDKRALEDRIAQLESALGQSKSRVVELEEAAHAAEQSRASERQQLQAQIREKEQRLEEATKKAAERREEMEVEAQKEDAQKQEALKEEVRKQEAEKQEAQKQEAQKQEAQKEEAQTQEAQKRADAERDVEKARAEAEEADKRRVQQEAEERSQKEAEQTPVIQEVTAVKGKSPIETSVVMEGAQATDHGLLSESQGSVNEAL